MRNNRKAFAALLVIAVIVSLLTPVKPARASQDIDLLYILQDLGVVLENNEYSMKVGDSVDLGFLGAPSNWKSLFKGWTSSNKAVAIVDNKGVVTAKSQGTTYITANFSDVCKGSVKITVGNTVTLGVAEKRSMESLYFENPSDSLRLGFYGVSDWNNVKKGVRYTWTSSDPKVVTVDNKGVVTAVSAGTSTVSLKIRFLNGAVIETVPCIVTVDKSVKVASQKQLEVALADKSVTRVVIGTEKKSEFNIPKGDYKNVKLVVDAPNADIINNGLFESISIARIANDTFIEMRVGNSLIVLAPTAHVIIAEGAKVDSIRVVDNASSDNANQTSASTSNLQSLNIEVKGSVSNIVLDTNAAITIDVSGTVENVAVNSTAELEIKGETKETIAVVVSDLADGTKIESNVKVAVDTSSEAEINLAEGAEGSLIVANNSEKAVAVENHTKTVISVSDNTGKEETVVTGAKKVVEMATPTPTNTPVPTATNTPVPTATRRPVYSATNTPVPTATNTPVPTATNTPVPTATNTPVPTATNTPVPTATNTPVPTATNTPVPTATNTPVPTATNTPVPTATNTPVPTATNTPVPTATNTPVPTATNTPVPTATNTPVPTATNTPVPTATNTPVPTATNTPVPTATNTPVPTATNTPVPTATNTPVPTATNTPTPTLDPNRREQDYVTINGRNLISEARFYREGRLARKQTFEYNENGKQTSMTATSYNPRTGEVMSSTVHTYSYDDEGRKILDEQHDINGNYSGKAETTYTSSNNTDRDETVHYDENNNIIGKDITETTYDSNGNETRVVSRIYSLPWDEETGDYDLTAELYLEEEFTYEYTYDENGDEVSSEEHHRTYDAQGNIIAEE